MDRLASRMSGDVNGARVVQQSKSPSAWERLKKRLDNLWKMVKLLNDKN
jgi:hypothetical protein